MTASFSKRFHQLWVLLAAILLPCIAIHGANGADHDQQIQAMLTELRGLADSSEITPAGRDARMASVVRLTVVRSTSGLNDPSAVLDTASRITDAALRAAPASSEAILNAVALAPVIARMDGGAQRLREAVIGGGAPARTTTATFQTYAEPAAVVIPAVKRQSVAGAEQRSAKQEPRPNVRQSAGTAESSPYVGDPGLSFSLGESTSFDLTADVSIERDNNLFLSESDKVADTIISVTPGVSFQFGRSALAGGSFAYQQSFLSYADKNAPSTSLGAGNIRFAYDNGRTSVATSLTYQQVNQNNRDTATLGDRIFQRDLFDASVGTELGLGSKIRLRTGAGFSSTDYRSAALIGTRQVDVPLKVYFALTPKTSLSVGTSYRHVSPQGDNAGASSRDFFHNLGIRGTLAPKLSGELSVGYRTRDVGTNPSESLWGFDGSFNLETSARSSLSFLLARDFSTGALGESLQNNRYTLRFSLNPTDSWSLGSALSYFTADYGAASFSQSNSVGNVSRTDRFIEGSLLTSYAFTRWFSASADYSLRSNDSSLPTAEFSNNVLKLNMRFRY